MVGARLLSSVFSAWRICSDFIYLWELVPSAAVFSGASCFPNRCAVTLRKQGTWACTQRGGTKAMLLPGTEQQVHPTSHHVALLPQVFTRSVSLHCVPVPSEDVSR